MLTTDEGNPTTGKGVTYLACLLLDPEGYNLKILLFTFEAVKTLKSEI